MKALILGASGQVGRALLPFIEARGWAWEGSYFQHPEVDPRLFPLDLGDPKACAAAVAARRPDAVLLPSGFTWVDGCEDDPGRARRVNALAPEAVARECGKLGSALVFYSTDYVFPEHGGPWGEADPVRPLSAYGRSKLEGERLVAAACRRALVLRTNVVYGPEPQGKNFVYQLIRSLKAGKPMACPEDQLSSPTYNEDLARASVELLEAGETGLWNVGGSDVIGRASFGRQAAEAFGLDPSLVLACDTASLKQKAPRPLSAGLKLDKLTARLGWTPRGTRLGLASMRAALEGKAAA